MEGLDKFRDAFKEFSDNYVIIGGTACDITMAGTEVRPRATHDIDMIIVVEQMTSQYGECFGNSFVKVATDRKKATLKKESHPNMKCIVSYVGNRVIPK